MIRSLAWKLTLAFSLVALTAAALLAAAILLTSPGQLDRLIVEQQRSELRSTLVVWKINFAMVGFSGLTGCDSVAHLLRQGLGDEPCQIASPANSS